MGGALWRRWRGGPAHGAGKAELERRMQQAGADAGEILARAEGLGGSVADAAPVALLRRVLAENFRLTPQGGIEQLETTPPDAIQSPQDLDARWSTKRAISAEGWVGYKAQICETAPEQNRQKGEPTEALITAVRDKTQGLHDVVALRAVEAAVARGDDQGPRYRLGQDRPGGRLDLHGRFMESAETATDLVESFSVACRWRFGNLAYHCVHGLSRR